MNITEKKDDVDRYLTDEPLNPTTSSFDILIWWKDNSERYKILSMIARDVLAIQVSTVASESAFSTNGRILDPFRSSLSAEMVEALVCTQSWLKGQQGGLKLDNYVDDAHSYQFIQFIQEGICYLIIYISQVFFEFPFLANLFYF